MSTKVDHLELVEGASASSPPRHALFRRGSSIWPRFRVLWVGAWGSPIVIRSQEMRPKAKRSILYRAT